jgi:hypothetical protein
MGSLISLGVGNLEIDWGKNDFFRNHSRLFLPDDRNSATYYYADNIREDKPALVRRLASVKRRLELLGYTINECMRQFNELMANHPNRLDKQPVAFEEFAEIIRRVDVERQGLPDSPENYDLGEYVTENILSDPEFTKTLPSLKSLERDAGTLLENLDPYVVLRLLAENPDNLEKPVIWRFADVLEGGYVAEDELFEHLQDSDRYLVVTEGSSDSKILQRSLELLLPDISDFFDFIDMSENYPFTGTGNLLRFCQGLVRIRIQNRILVVIDNDTAGNEVLTRLRSLDLPSKMMVAVLPNLSEFDVFETIGPSGTSLENINGKAVSIEMFLDLGYQTHGSPIVRWTSFNRELGQYHGELIDKQQYVRLYLDKGWQDSGYDCFKLRKLWNHLFQACIVGI